MTHPLNRLSTITKTKLETILMCVILGRIAFALSEQSSERANANFFRHKRSFDDSWFDCNIFAPSLTKIPGAEEMCHGRAFLLCGPLLQGCSWMTEKRESQRFLWPIKFSQFSADSGYSLPVRLQLADLEENHEVIFTVTGSCLWTGHGRQFGGRYCVEKD